ncbi:MAG: hypothetical protein QM656_14905 [Paracoccaceae bacterium]
MTRLTLAVVLTLAAAPALAAGCPPKDGLVLEQVEALNQMIVDRDFSGFVAGIRKHLGTDVAAPMAGIEQIFKDGFDGCTTIAQRVDTGGMVQHIVVFHGKAGPLFGYWLAMNRGEGAQILRFNINTDIDAVMAALK